jgi:hypothetical protein
LLESSFAATGHPVGLFNAEPLMKLDKNDFIEGVFKLKNFIRLKALRLGTLFDWSFDHGARRGL